MSIWLGIWVSFFLGVLAAYLRLRATYVKAVTTCQHEEQRLRNGVPAAIANRSPTIVDIIIDIIKANEPVQRISRAKWTMLFTTCILWIAFSLEFMAFSLQGCTEEIFILIRDTSHALSMVAGYVGLALMSLTLLLLVHSEART